VHEPTVQFVGGPEATVAARLADHGVRLVMGTAVDLAGVVRTKAVPRSRFSAFITSGMGASPSWLVFCVDWGIAFIPELGVVGDLRLRIDPAAAAIVDSGVAWAPAQFHQQDGTLFAACPRGRLREVLGRLQRAGLQARTGAELEFVLTTPEGGPRAGGPWQGYGVRTLLDVVPLMTELVDSFHDAGMPVEQVHPEYAGDQFEISLPPSDPLTTADRTVLARILIGGAARRHGFGVSFSPLPFVGGAGSGAHLHLSLSDGNGPLFSGGPLAHGLTASGAAAIGGLVDRLPEVQALLAGSVLSSQRLRPGNWAGAFACWGLENREAALRLVARNAGNPHGASVEIKVIDASANPYLAAAVVLGSALDGIQRELPLPPEVTVNPASLSEAEQERLALTTDQTAALDLLDGSAFARGLLGDLIVDGTLSVRRYETRTFAGAEPEDVAAAFRMAFSC
jgi:glutamine synthetase